MGDKALIPVQNDQSGWLMFVFITLVFVGAYFVIFSFVNIVEIANDWQTYRCNPMIMPFASLFGHNTTENFNFCVGNILNSGASSFTGPFASILQMFIGSLMTVMSSLNSFRVVLATLMGGITSIFQEITERFKVLISNIIVTQDSLKRLMGKMFATFYAIIYMGTSGIQAGTNFTNSFLFNFLDTFCFAPSTLIEVRESGMMRIDEVEIGDLLANGQIVTAIYSIRADGQKMVRLGHILVSANHYVIYNGVWIRADAHPDARADDSWNGGKSSPLICLDTSTHIIHIGDYVFSDYNELDSTDNTTMKAIQDILNNTKNSPLPPESIRYSPSLAFQEEIIMKDGKRVRISNIRIGDELSNGTVYGIVKRKQDGMFLYNNTIIHGSTLVWVVASNKWERVYNLPETTKLYKKYETYNLLVMNSGIIETPNVIIRDLMELHDPDIEKITTDELCRLNLKI
jgi:hypothetical protein